MSEDLGKKGSFVFGQNMAERVAKKDPEPIGETPVLSPVKAPKSGAGTLSSPSPLLRKMGAKKGDGDSTSESRGDDAVDVADDGDNTTQMSSEEIFGHSIPKPSPEMAVPSRSLGLSGAVPSRPFGGAGVLTPPVTNPFASSSAPSRVPHSAAAAAAAAAAPGVVSSTTNSDNGDKNEGFPDSSTDIVKPVLQPPTLQINAAASDKTAKSTNEKQSDHASSRKPALAPSKLSAAAGRSSPLSSTSRGTKASGAASAAASTAASFSSVPNSGSNQKPSLLRPSALDAHTANWKTSANAKKSGAATSNTFTLEPAIFGASTSLPTLGKIENSSVDNSFDKANGDSNHPVVEDKTPNIFAAILKQQSEAKTATTIATSGTTIAAVGTTIAAAQTSSSSFIFGQNLQSRVVSGNENQRNNGGDESSGGFGRVVAADDAAASAGDILAGAGSTSSLNNAGSSGDGASGRSASPASVNSKTLTQAAAEVHAKQSGVKISEPYVDVKTGEEDESNVLQITCKLFLFSSSSSSWIERGRGFLRLNDMPQAEGDFKSRLVMRAQGSLRLILNTQLWSGMTVVRANSKSVRVTCLDEEGKPMIYLIQANLKDAEALMRAMEYRIQQRRRCDELLQRRRAAPASGGSRDDDEDDDAPRSKKRVHSSSARESPQSSSLADDDDNWDDEVTSTSKCSPKDGKMESTPEKKLTRRSLDSVREENDSSSSDLSPGSANKSPASESTKPLPPKRRRSELPVCNKRLEHQMPTEASHGSLPCSSGSHASHVHRSPDSEAAGLSTSVASSGVGGRNSSASTSDSHHESGTSTPPDPETEASNESYTSSITTHSLSE